MWVVTVFRFSFSCKSVLRKCAGFMTPAQVFSDFLHVRQLQTLTSVQEESALPATPYFQPLINQIAPVSLIGLGRSGLGPKLPGVMRRYWVFPSHVLTGKLGKYFVNN